MGLFDHLYHFDWTAHYPLEYYYNDGRHAIFDKYEIDMFGNMLLSILERTNIRMQVKVILVKR